MDVVVIHQVRVIHEEGVVIGGDFYLSGLQFHEETAKGLSESDWKLMNALPFIILLDEPGRAVEPPSINMCLASHTFVIGHGWGDVTADLLYHQLTDGPIHLGSISNVCSVGHFAKL